MYKLLSQIEVKKYLDSIKSQDVSKRARKPDGFTSIYLNEGLKGLEKTYPNKKHNYLTERELFIKRHLAQYVKNPTERRKLALIAWAYIP